MSKSKREKISLEKKKKRIPVPRKPPKIEKNKKAYNRKIKKNETIKIIEESGKRDD